MRLDALAEFGGGPGLQVGGRADFKGDAAVADPVGHRAQGHQAGVLADLLAVVVDAAELDLDVLGDAHAVSQALGAPHDQGFLDGLKAGGLARVHRGREEVLGQQVEGLLHARGRESVLGTGDVEADDAARAVPQGQLRDFDAAVGVAHGGDDLADLDRGSGLREFLAGFLEPALDGLDGVVQAESLAQVLLGGPAHLAVDHAVLDEVLDEFACHAGQRGLGLHHSDGVVEGFQVAFQRPGVGGGTEPGAEFLGIGGGKFVSRIGGQLDDGLRAQPPIEVVVERDLGQGPEVEGRVIGNVDHLVSHLPSLSGLPGFRQWAMLKSGQLFTAPTPPVQAGLCPESPGTRTGAGRVAVASPSAGARSGKSCSLPRRPKRLSTACTTLSMR